MSDGPFEVRCLVTTGMAWPPSAPQTTTEHVVGTYDTLAEALQAAAGAQPTILTVEDEKRATHELRFERDLAERNLIALDMQRERLMSRVFRLDRILDRRGGG